MIVGHALVELGDRFRELRDPADLAHAAGSILGRELDVSRVGYAAIDHDTETLHVERDWTAPGVDSLAGTLPLRRYGSFVDNLKQGEFTVINDVREDARTASAAKALEEKSTRSFVNAPVLEQGRLVAVFFVNAPTPREWSAGELALIREFADRTRLAVERARAEISLRNSEERYRTLFERLDEAFCVIEFVDGPEGPLNDYVHVEANPAFVANTGLTEIVGKRLREVVAHDEAEGWLDIYRKVLLSGEPVRFERDLGVTDRNLEVAAFRIEPAEKRQIAVLFKDVTARRRAEERLRELNENLEAQVAARIIERDGLWNLSQDMLARADFSGMMSAVSPAWTAVLGWTQDQLLTRPYASFMHDEDMPPTLAAIGEMAETGQPARFINRIATADGDFKHIDWTVAPEPDGINFVAVGRDVSEAKAREAELRLAQDALRQSQKMEAMGSLTGGVAHDFNNLLTPIIGSLDLLVRKKVGTEREQKLIDGALHSAERAKTLVQRLLAFARRQPLQPVPVDMTVLLDGIAELLDSTLGPTIDIRMHVDPDVSTAHADPNQLEMALLNLAVNARDAMPSGGELEICVDNQRVAAGQNEGVKAGSYVRITVRDSGTGMSPEVLARAVDPFYSTKGVGKGTGLGLSMVHGLAAQLGGGLALDTKLGEGTTVTLLLPSASAEADSASRPKVADGHHTRGGIALLVDDEELVRFSTAEMLSELGFEVLEAASAEEAIEIIDKGAQLDILVTDHLMPGMSGADLARSVKTRQPELPILIVSGYADVEGIAPDLRRLAKPFRRAELAAAVGQLVPGRI